VFVAREVPDDIGETEIACADGLAHLPEVIALAFGGSRSDARRALSQGGVRLDGQPVAAGELDVACARLDGAVLQVGKRRFRRLRVVASAA
jgi:tyrosyl-tRNA synthetase